MYVSLLAPSPPRELSVKLKEGTRLILQWRKPEETNGIIKKYEIHFTDGDGATKTYTSHSDLEKEYLTYEVSLTDVQMEYEIKVWKRYIIIMKGHEKRSKSKAFVVRKDLFIVCLTMGRPIEDNPDSEISESFASKIRNHGHWNPEFR